MEVYSRLGAFIFCTLPYILFMLILAYLGGKIRSKVADNLEKNVETFQSDINNWRVKNHPRKFYMLISVGMIVLALVIGFGFLALYFFVNSQYPISGFNLIFLIMLGVVFLLSAVVGIVGILYFVKKSSNRLD